MGRGGDDPEFRDFYALKKPWPFAHRHAVLRNFEMGRLFDDVRGNIEVLEAFHEKWKEHPVEGAHDVLKVKFAIETLMRNLESIEYVFPELEKVGWFAHACRELASIHWRVEKHEELTTDEALARRLFFFIEHVRGPPGHDLVSKLYLFFEDLAGVGYVKVAPEFEDDMGEVRDYIALRHWATALLVVGRAVERVLLLLGQERQVEAVSFSSGKKLGWADAPFAHRVRAMQQIPTLDGHSKVLNKPRYHEAQILVHHRNQLAHSDYALLKGEDGPRMVQNALSLLEHLSRELVASRDAKSKPPPIGLVALSESAPE